jgi:hypothetical protein
MGLSLEFLHFGGRRVCALYQLHAFVVTPNHVYLLVSPGLVALPEESAWSSAAPGRSPAAG